MRSVGICVPIDRRSAIAHATLGFAAELAAHADITILAEPTDQPLPCHLPVRSLATMRSSDLRAYDRLIAVYGNSGFHRYTFALVRRIPALAIVHDVSLAHLAAGVLSRQELADELRRWYPPDLAASSIGSLDGAQPFWMTADVLQTPLFEPAVEDALGVIVHSRFAAALVAERSVAPVRAVPLAYPVRLEPDPAARAERADPRVLVTLGHANANKNHELVIDALAELRDASVRYVIAGAITRDRRERLIRYAAGRGVADQVEILGTVSSDTVEALLRTNTVCVNLRHPAVESGSASLIEQMAAGCSVVTFDHAAYADPPDDALVKLPLSTSGADLAAVLGALLEDTDRRARIGRAAVAHVREHHGFRSYARHVLQLLDDIETERPIVDLAHAVSGATRSWRMPPGIPWAASVARTITDMFGGVQDSGRQPRA